MDRLVDRLKEYWEIDLVPSWGLPCATRCSAGTTPDFVLASQTRSSYELGKEAGGA